MSRRFSIAAAVLACSLASTAARPAEVEEKPVTTETATFGGGCFWCLEAIFEELQGVTKVVSGYAGGRTADPGYEEVCSGRTGHAEVVQVAFDPRAISYARLLEVFFASHDPTTANRQGADVGTQYRSIILVANEQQEQDARAFVKLLTREKVFARPIVTEIVGLGRFYAAEPYHQDYFRHNPDQAYCQVVINPKLQQLRKKFTDLLKP